MVLKSLALNLVACYRNRDKLKISSESLSQFGLNVAPSCSNEIAINCEDRNARLIKRYGSMFMFQYFEGQGLPSFEYYREQPTD